MPMIHLLKTARQRCLRELIGRSVRPGAGKLVMTLLVRDEVDIVKANLEFHLAHGVDFIVATDNGSVDGTDEILARYEKLGVLQLIREPDQSYRQSQWVNRMGRLALERHRADMVFHCDADEFWWPHSGSLKNELAFRRRTEVLQVGVTNMIFARLGGAETFREACRYAVTRSVPSANQGVDSLKTSFFLFASPGKVMYRTDRGYLEVGQGNHAIVGAERDIVQRESADISILHYPLRSYAHFQGKVINGGSAYEKNPTKAGGWQWRRWYEIYKQGGLPDEFRHLTLGEEECRGYLRAGVLSDWSTRHSRICSYL